MFYLINSGKSCLFRSLVGFLKNTNRQKGGLQPRCCIAPPPYGVRAHRGRKTRSEMSFLGSGKMEQKELKD